MNQRWPTARCILCLSRDGITREHLIPGCVGGKLVMEFLCKNCNDKLGHSVEGEISKDKDIQLGIERLVKKRPDKANDLQKKLKYIGHSDQGPVAGYVQGDKFIAKGKRLDDGSFISPPDKTLDAVKTRCEREGKEPLDVTPDELNSLPSGSSKEVAHGLSVTNWPINSLQLDLSGPNINPVVPAKIAFEFIALHCPDRIYDDAPQLWAIRHQLVGDCKLSDGDIHVERLKAENKQLFHGLVFEGNSPGARVQIRLFGQLAFRVQFLRFAVSGMRMGYTHDLICENAGLWNAEETTEDAEDSLKG